jgi:glycosyltransferase involved in cell wall biosynthesis
LEEYKNLSVSLGIDSFIEWLSVLNRAQVCESLQQSDCFIMPSKSESLGVVYIEAIACGKPVIATNCGGPADIINDGNGLLVETGNVDAIANAMIYMIEHGKEYNSEFIRQDFLQRFSRQPVVKKVKQFYDEAIEA